MKHTLPLLLFFLLFSVGITAQTSVSERFASDNNRAHLATNTIKIFPNPAVDYISISGSAKVERVVIYNLVGRKTKTFRTQDGDKYNVTDLPKGMYLVQLLGAGDDIITTRRLQKQ